MKKLLDFIIKGITGSDDYKIEESVEDNQVRLTINANPEIIGLIIGKGGSTIRSIRNILRIKGTLDKKGVFVEVLEKN